MSLSFDTLYIYFYKVSHVEHIFGLGFTNPSLSVTA